MRILGVPLPVLPFAWLLAACVTSADIGGQEGEDLEDTDTNDADTAEADTDVDGDDTADADTAGGRDYVGPFVIDAVDAAGLADRCAGTIALQDVAGTLTGEGECTFSGPLATPFPDGLGADVSGSVEADDTASGACTFTLGASGTLPWSGTLGTDLAGTFSGTLTTASTTLTVTGRFDAAPE